jgi:hypothetical protein
MPVVYVIEEKPKIFDLIKKILRIKDGEKNIFLYGDADFSVDIKKYMTENNVLVFRLADTPAAAVPADKIDVDLVILGECRKTPKKFDIASLGNIRSVLLNIENSRSVNCSDKNAQIITCGLKEKDTAIFSSINLDEGNVILDLQRSVKNIDGVTLEPSEKQIFIPEAVRKESSEDLLLSLTALVFCNRM